MKNYTFLTTLLLFSIHTIAQNTFQIQSDTLGILTNVSIEDLLLTADGEYMICGYRQPANSIFSREATIIKINQNGEAVWSKSFNGVSTAERVIETSDSGLVILGNDDDPVIIRTDKNGVVQWSKTFGYYSGVVISVVAADDGFAFLSGDGGTLICITKTDLQGIIEWSYTYGASGTGSSAHLFKIVKTDDDGYVICGNKSSAFDYEMFLMKIDNTGNVKWTKKYGGYPSSSINDMLVTDSGFMVCGDGRDGITEHTFLMQIDTAGSIGWHKEFILPNNLFANEMIQTSDGGFALSCDGSFTYPMLLKVDSIGSTQWAKSYGDSSFTSKPWVLALAADKGIVFGGSIGTPIQGSIYGSYFIAKTDVQGNSFCTEQWYPITPIVDSIDAISISFVKQNSNFELNDLIFENQVRSDTFNILCSSTDILPILPQNSWSIYPNPFQLTASIDFSLTKSSLVSIEIFNLLGQKVKTILQNENQAAGKHQYTFSGVGEGIYFVEMKVDGKMYTQKIVCAN